ncbi:hypothetical protein LCGC14_1928640, partial [marine sediment metagenome]
VGISEEVFKNLTGLKLKDEVISNLILCLINEMKKNIKFNRRVCWGI